MGPGNSSSGLPSRPRASWDIKTVPWTDGKGNLQEFAAAVRNWCEFHDELIESNANKVPTTLCGLFLQSHLYGRARDLCKGIPKDKIKSKDGPQAIFDAIYQRDPLSVVTEVHKDLTDLLQTRRGTNESFRNFESRFAAQLSKFNSHESSLPDSISGLILLGNAAPDNAQRISILAAASPKKDDGLTNQSKTSEYLDKVSYASIAGILRQCDRPKTSDVGLSSSTITASGGNVTTPVKRVKQKLSPTDFASLKAKSKCRRCERFGHWASDHKEDGSLKAGVGSTEQPVYNSGTHGADEKKTLKFNMAHLLASNTNSESDRCMAFTSTAVCNSSESKASSISNSTIGPLVDDGAPYSAIGLSELQSLADRSLPSFNGKLLAIPNTLPDVAFWQYGNGSHASEKRRILGSVMLPVLTDSHDIIEIRHLVLDGSSQWVIGRNVTSHCDIRHLGSNSIVFQYDDTSSGTISLVNHKHHCYMPMIAFTMAAFSRSMSSMSSDVTSNDSPKLTTIVDKVHKHTCGHATFTDMKTLLERNGIWNQEVNDYLASVMNSCTACKHTAQPVQSRKVSLSSLSATFNDTVCIDHFYLDGTRLFRAMDASSRYSTAVVVPDASLESALIAFEAGWMSQFWSPISVLGDDAFNKEVFLNYLSQMDISFKPVPARRHSKNPIESKHGIIRSVFLRLRSTSETSNPILCAYQAVRISNDLYGSDTMSAFELAKGFTKPIVSSCTVTPIPDEIRTAQEQLAAQRKLVRILRSKAPRITKINVGDLVKVYIKHSNQKRGSWTAARTVLAVDNNAGIITVPGASGKLVTAAIEDVRPAVLQDDFALQIQAAQDTLEDELHYVLNVPQPSNTDEGEPCAEIDFTDDDPPNLNATTIPNIGDRVDVFWPLENTYLPGTVTSLNEDGKHHISYDDGDQEDVNFADETWRFSTSVFSAQSASLPKLTSNDQDVLQCMFQAFGNKSFLRFHAQGFPSFVLDKAYTDEEEAFKRTVCTVALSSVPANANVIASHVLYKVKVNDDGTLKIKARIAPHGNEDSQKDSLKTDCCVCAPTGIRILLSIATINRWRISKADVKSAFLQTGDAQRDVYVIPPYESVDKGKSRWLLLAAAYGLVNSNAKWQVMSDHLLTELGFKQVPFLPQLFYCTVRNRVVAVLCKIVDDLLMTGERDIIDRAINKFNERFSFGTVSHGPGCLRYYGLNIVQSDDLTSTIDGDDKLSSLEGYPISRPRRRENSAPLNTLERDSFVSVNSSVGWLGIAASPFCAHFASHFQQRLPTVTVSNLVTQLSALKRLKQLGTTISYTRPNDARDYCCAALVFSDAARSVDHGQLCFITGLLIGDFARDSVFHTVSWISHKSRRPVKSSGAAETLAAGEAIDEGNVISATFSLLLGMHVPLWVAVDSKDLYTSLSTQRNSVDRSIRADVNVIRYEFETRAVSRVIWIPGSINIADAGTKADSPLTQPLQLMLYTGKLPLDYAASESSSSSKPLG